MKTFILSLIFVSALTGCANVSTKEAANESDSPPPVETTVPSEPPIESLSLNDRILSSLNDGETVVEIDNPGMFFPEDVQQKQVKKYFRVGDVLFALALQPSMNVPLNVDPDEVNFVGILSAKVTEDTWSKWLEIVDLNSADKNNPYAVWSEENTLFLSVVNQNGAGSGEGIMSRYTLDQDGVWRYSACYYFGANYSDPETDGDYFTHSSDILQQEVLSMSPTNGCGQIELIES